mgnify:CR=1 FL=1
MKIHIEFCVRWNYGPEFDRVSNNIKELYPKAIIEGNKDEPRSGAFEITLNGNLIYSKFSTNSFPSKEKLKELLDD